MPSIPSTLKCLVEAYLLHRWVGHDALRMYANMVSELTEENGTAMSMHGVHWHVLTLYTSQELYSPATHA